jgi:pimeloyl-ACP methyl ester carboxylesterase
VPRPTLLTADDVPLAARRRLAGDQPDAAVVVVHGFTASADDPKVEATATALHGLGVDVVTYDARGHGASGGASTLGDLERHDVAAAVDLARRRTDRVVLVGASMGAIAVLRHAATDPHLSGVVAISCPSHWRLPRNPHGVAAAAMTRTPFGRALAARFLGVTIASRWGNPEPPAELVGRVRVPIALVHGTADRFIPVEAAETLHAAAGDPRRLEVVPGMGHAFDASGLPAILGAVAWALDHRPAPLLAS